MSVGSWLNSVTAGRSESRQPRGSALFLGGSGPCLGKGSMFWIRWRVELGMGSVVACGGTYRVLGSGAGVSVQGVSSGAQLVLMLL